MTKARINYTKEFKLAILSQVESGIPVVQVARENGLHSALVFRWKKEFMDSPEKAFAGSGHPYKDQARVAELDLYTRKCIGWSLSYGLDTETALDALQMALYEHRDQDLTGLVHHSDRGTQYTSFAFTQCLRDHAIQISNSRKGNPYDNAFVESFFKTLKYEEVYLNEYETFEDAWDNIQAFIEDVYNSKRMHSALGYLSPMEFEQKFKDESKGEIIYSLDS